MSSIGIGGGSPGSPLTVSSNCDNIRLDNQHTTTNVTFDDISNNSGGWITTPAVSGHTYLNGIYGSTHLDCDTQRELMNAAASSRKTRHILEFLKKFRDEPNKPELVGVYLDELKDRFKHNELEDELRMEVLLLLGD